MSARDRIGRREILGASLATGLLAAARASPIIAASLTRTPTQSLGPFYPLTKPLDQDADLTIVAGKTGRASGQVIHVMGRVLNRLGKPAQGTRIEIWQANARGRYTHPGDHNPAPLDPNFQGYGSLITDSLGRYRFKTIKPGAYGDSGFMRAPHIHFDVRGQVNRIVTQMYFSGEPLNEKDWLLRSAGADSERLIVPLEAPLSGMEPDSLLAIWNIVLEEG